MKSIKEITEKYNDTDFGIEISRDKIFPKRVEIKSFWGNLTIYENICRDLRNSGYTVLG